MSQVRQELELASKAEALVTDRAAMDNYAYYLRACAGVDRFDVGPLVRTWAGTYDLVVRLLPDVGLRADGRVEVAGDNRKGQCRAEDLRDVISVACLPEATLCVRADGRVTVRGGDGEPDKAVEALREVVAIHTCEHRVAALTADRRVIYLP
jgi:hypothetical protein